MADDRRRRNDSVSSIMSSSNGDDTMRWTHEDTPTINSTMPRDRQAPSRISQNENMASRRGTADNLGCESDETHAITSVNSRLPSQQDLFTRADHVLSGAASRHSFDMNPLQSVQEEMTARADSMHVLSGDGTPRPSYTRPSQEHATSRAEETVNVFSEDSFQESTYMVDTNTIHNNNQEPIMTDVDARHRLFEMLDQMPDMIDIDIVTSYQRASMLPPVTQTSLAELDVGRIVNNLKLRHDVNFDRELHFRPNLDGSRGKQKQKIADEYWKALLAELELYVEVGYQIMNCQDDQDRQMLFHLMEVNQVRLPGMFATIKNVLMSLVPQSDQAMVEARLDVTMIMQQICRGVFNLLDLAKWLADVFKAHCAPMRDEWINNMVKQFHTAAEEQDQAAVVVGLRQTLAILEAMKLDVANHQIRHLRTSLIHDTVNFQQKYHIHKINLGRMSVNRARAWFKREESYLNQCNLQPTPLESFASAVFRSLLSENQFSAQFPETFHLDGERLRTLRNDLLGFVKMDICLEAFDLLARDRLDGNAREAGKQSLKAKILAIVGESQDFDRNCDNVVAEIVRHVLELEHSGLNTDIGMVDFVGHHIQANMQPNSASFGIRLQDLFEAQFPRLCTEIKSSSRLSILALHDTMLPPIQPPIQLIGHKKQVPLIDSILKRITHLAILHWHIWSSIVYDVHTDEAFSRHSSAGSNGSNGTDEFSVDHNATAPSAFPSTPDISTHNSGLTQPSGSSVVDGRPQE